MYDIIRSTAATKRALLIVPGVTGHSQDCYIIDLADSAYQNGYYVCVMNAVGPPPGYGDEIGLETCDFTDNVYIEQAIELMRQ